MWSQNITISGYVSDDQSGEPLIGASVYNQKTWKGTTTNAYGFFSLTLPKDSIILKVSYIGYQTKSYEVLPEEDIELQVALESTLELKTFEVKADQKDKIQTRTQMSSTNLSMEKVKSLPALLGEQDVMKTMQLLPGVQSGSEGASGVYVRGGGSDQNLILLDGVPVYNASHLFGFFSIFNADVINNLQLIKGGFPARYGGRLSSVIDIRVKEGNMKEFHGEGSIGLISSKLTLEGPIFKDKTSFLISGRRTYIDLLTKPFLRDRSEGTGGYYFYDFNAKIKHQFNSKHKIYFSNYLGNDRFYASGESEGFRSGDISKSDSGIKWGNIISALRWNYQVNNKLFSNTTLTYSRYKFDISSKEETFANDNLVEGTDINYFSSIEDWTGKIDFDYLPSPSHYIKFGGGNTYHTFKPGVSAYKSSGSQANDVDTTFGSSAQYGNEFYAYIEDDLQIMDRLKANLGFHFSGFSVGEETYFSYQPRIGINFLLNGKSSVKASYSMMTQYLHLLTNSGIGLPTDLWVPATENVKPQSSQQVALGYAQTVKEKFELSVEGYYKKMDNLIEYKEGASFFSQGQDWQEKIEVGEGWSYGVEFLFEKKIGKTSGWIGYTLSWANRKFDNLNLGETFPYRYDRRHDIGIAITHEFNDRVDIGVTWVYGTGNAVTLATERYQSIDGRSEIEYIDSRNNYRVASYHRLDCGVNFHKKKKSFERTWSFGVYNIYSRQNPFYLYFENEELKQISLFPIIPSISYGFKF